jgi:hypothetical protein
MNIPPVITDVMVHVYPHAATRVQVHPAEDRVVIGLHDRTHGSGALTLFVDRAALSMLHALTGTALTELAEATEEKAAEAAECSQAADSAA